MKITNKFKTLLYGGLVLLGFLTFSCSDVERFPKTSVEQSQSFQSIEDAERWDNGLYSQVRSSVYGLFMFSTDVQADQLNATLDFGNRNGFPHRWEGFLSDDYTIRDVWYRYYTALSNINAALEGFETITLDDPEDTEKLNKFKGDMHLARAYFYQQLVLRYAKAYDKNSAGSDLGVPLVLTFDVEAFPSRNTVQEVYNQILDDISAAKTLLSGTAGEQGAQKFNIDVVYALEARVKLYMQDYEGAYAAANKLITSGTYPLITSLEGLDKMWEYDFGQETILQINAANPNEIPNVNAIYLGYNPGLERYSPDFVPSQWVVDAYSDDDYRKAVYFDSTKAVQIMGTDYEGIYLVDKYPGNPDLFVTQNTNYRHKPKLFRIAEMYLIAAESAFKTGDEGTALDLLNALREARNLEPVDVTGDELWNEIKEERFRELAFEGFRLDDLKRWNEGFERHDPQNMDLIQIGPNYQSLQKEAGADKFVWGIPSRDQTVNPNITQNPGW